MPDLFNLQLAHAKQILTTYPKRGTKPIALPRTTKKFHAQNVLIQHLEALLATLKRRKAVLVTSDLGKDTNSRHNIDNVKLINQMNLKTNWKFFEKY